MDENELSEWVWESRIIPFLLLGIQKGQWWQWTGQGGCILVGGQNLRNFKLAWWRRNIGMVSQEGLAALQWL